jgi:hypothetical protein
VITTTVQPSVAPWIDPAGTDLSDGRHAGGYAIRWTGLPYRRPSTALVVAVIGVRRVPNPWSLAHPLLAVRRLMWRLLGSSPQRPYEFGSTQDADEVVRPFRRRA